ncbi:MAG: glycosyltransferase family 39 protein [Patescibacteria group bacterium]
MFSIAILIGIYSYLIFLIGLLGFLNIKSVFPLSVIFLFLSVFYIIKVEKKNLKATVDVLKNKPFLFLLSIFILQVLVNFIGTLGPELGFDALWYHLILPKLYLLSNAIVHIPGNLLYYSDMPKLTEMLYTVGLIFGNETIPKLISFFFGILTCMAIYRISRNYLSSFFSFLAVIIFYSNLVVGWQSITAYVDLPRTFFEAMALWGFLNFTEKKEKKWLVESAVILGLAISVKLISLGSVAIFVFLIAYFLYKSKESIREIVSNIILFALVSITIPLPWFIFSIIHTGNPIYPILTDIYPVSLSLNLLNPISFVKDVLTILIKSEDPLSPVYLIFIPLIGVYYKKIPKNIKIILFYSVISFFVWYITPRTGGGRFILPYLPAYSILISFIIAKIKNKTIQKYSILLIFVIAVSSISYRGIANSKYLPVVFGKESKESFLSSNLNFSFGDFYDTDGYFKNNIKETDRVLLYGFHNLYYVNFPFVDSSWVKKGDDFNYVAVQNSKIPERFSDWSLVYSNSITRVKLYTKGEIRWAY